MTPGYQATISGLVSIASASLNLFGSVNDTSTLSLAAYSVAATSWTESGITWSNIPTGGTTALATTSVAGATAAWYSWNLTSYLQGQKTAGNNVVCIEIAGTTSTTGYADFNSKEAGSNQPQLVITVAAPTLAAAASGPASVTGKAAALTVLGTDSSGGSDITYSWAATAKPAGAPAPTFSPNAANPAQGNQMGSTLHY